MEWIEPLVSVEQFQKTIDVIERFFEENGEAEKLQKKLYEWGRGRDVNWLTPLWDDLYLKNRNSLPITSNFNVLLKNDAYKDRYSTMEIAGKVSYLVTELYYKIIDEALEPDKFRGQALDMSQYEKMFRSIRIPQKERDVFYVADFNKKNNHVVLLYKNNVYKIQVSDHEGEIYQSQHITAAIEKLIESDEERGTNVGIFTTANRDQAAKTYNILNDSKVNAEILQTIADAIVVISIDEESKNSEEAINNLLLNANNKYFDKTIQVVITECGEVGFNVEHTAVDGTSFNTVVSYINKGLTKRTPQTIHSPQKPLVEKKQWDLTKEMLDMLEQLHMDHLQRTNNYSTLARIFTDFGAEAIKRMKVSPDAFFHMALQIAQYRTYGKFKSVYEPVTIRFFNEGRTECARATSTEKRNLVEAIESAEHSNEELYAFIQTASNAHSERIKECQSGYGIERHLYGLEQMYHLFGSELGLKQLPEIFSDQGYITLRHDFLSTSGTPYENAKYRMFVPTVNDGHGVAYFLTENSITINISSFTHNKQEGDQLMEHLIEAFKELSEIAKKEVEA